MYFKIGPKTQDPLFSYRIVKHPNSKFEKSIGKSDGRKVFGEFDENAHFYNGYVENDNLVFLETARGLNMSNYIHPQLAAVCPHNLKAFSLIFSSVIKGNKDSSLTEEEFTKSDLFEAVVGPFPCKPETVIIVFEKVGINAVPIESDNTKMVYMFNLQNISPISTTEFMQKLYVISYYLTNKYTMEKKLSDATIEKFIDLSKNWLDKCSMRNAIINRLCKYNKRLVEKFEISLIESDVELEEEEKTSKLSKLDEYLNKIGLHEKRYNLILTKIPNDCKTLLDLGSAEGKFLKFLEKERPDTKIIGLEANQVKAERANRKIKTKHIKIINSNVIYPKLSELDLKPDFLTAIEIIEHLNKEDREKLVFTILDVLVPKEFIITTPNIDYNKLYAIAEGEYRHRDHKIEYDYLQLTNEILAPLSMEYNIEILRLFPEQDIDPTFVVYGKLRNINRNYDQRIFYKIQNMYSSIYLDTVNYEINHKELSAGYSSLAYMSNRKNIFYLAPTMSPVDFNIEFPNFLEHPSACFKYYQERGIYELVAEEKYMGSRAYLLAFKNAEQAQAMGHKLPIIINSRSGFPFFDNDKILMKIYEELVSKIEKDFIILDCEIMPWSFKAKGLIDHDFTIPGECAYLSRKYGQYGNINNAEQYLSTVEHYGKESELEIRPFHILAEGNIKDNKFINVTLGFIREQIWHCVYSRQLQGDIFKPVNYHMVDLCSELSKEKSIKKWEEFCTDKGEGFVYKTTAFINYSKNGYYIQPMVKVRGKEYLRIIYGIDYLEEEYFRKVSFRKTKGKRNQAIQEFDLGIKILRAFLNNNSLMQEKLVAAFIGMENTNYHNIDATL